jgi:fatty-acyl-CoA synthase
VTIPAWSYTSGASDAPLIGETIGDRFDQTAARFPANEALVSRHQGLRYTYAALKTEVDRCARALMALGVQKGERVGIWAPNCAEWAILQFASAKIGAILVNVNPSYRQHEVQYALTQSGTKYLFIAPQFKTSNYTQMMYDVAPELRGSQPGKLKAAKLP